MEDYRIIRAEEKYCPGHTRTLSFVAHEGRYLSTNKGFTEEEILNFYHFCKAKDFPQFFVIDEGGEVVGWCDIVPREGYPATIGFIGVGLMPDYRGRGIGGELMEVTMAAAKEAGFREIRLDCRSSNERAIKLYKKLGFRRIASLRTGLVIDGENIPIICMKKRI